MQVYGAALDALLQFHLSLAAPGKRLEWYQKWSQAFESFESPDQLQQAMLEVFESLGERFDTLLPPAISNDDQRHFDAEDRGLGISCGVWLPDDNTFNQETTCLSSAVKLVVTEVARGSPARKAGLRACDCIESINGIDLNGLTAIEAVNMLVSTEHAISLMVSRQSERLVFIVAPGQYVRETVTHEYLDGDGQISYVRIGSFSSKFFVIELCRCLELANQSQIVIFDVRQNPGGDAELLAASLELVMPRLKGIESVERIGDKVVDLVFHFDETGCFENEIGDHSPASLAQCEQTILNPAIKAYVLVDEWTCSCAEVFAGALQFAKRATVIGTRTFGKGSTLRHAELPFGWAIRITNGKISIDGRELEKTGITPDIASHDLGMDDHLVVRVDSLESLADDGLIAAVCKFIRLNDLAVDCWKGQSDKQDGRDL
jgi:C-terminal processing protease CtpA/Prc